ncbi:hypothetical protein [Bacillus horti]|uniref:Uncharacterized protein n=1 Tax=Caldalkalibacillus horti TaxID=77523 RepID=A0ABT9VXK6_9BACI|nr:hypothetical protein [Bacillus horti]MDQ0165731.1 hypothetical protein [Bacillus horti]
MKHTEIRVEHLKFGSLVKWSIYVTLSAGIILGLLFSVLSLVGFEVEATLNGEQLTGVQQILFLLFVTPIMILLLGIFSSIILYLPMRLVLKIKKGISLKGLFVVEVSEKNENKAVEQESNLNT